MKSTFFTIIVSILCVVSTMAQSDPAAISILKNFSEKALSAPSVTMKFSMIVDDALEETHVETEGEIIIRGDHYKLTVPENIIWYNGEAIYTLVPEVEEVTITEPNPDDEAFFSSPSLLFTMYEEGYKIRLVGESGDGSLIDLYPENLDADFTRIRLLIGKNHDLKSAEYKRKDGISMLLITSEYNLKKKYNNDFFVFDERKYSNADLIDMRF